MKTMISILLLISITCGGLFYLYSEDGPIQQLEKEEQLAYKKAKAKQMQQAEQK